MSTEPDGLAAIEPWERAALMRAFADDLDHSADEDFERADTRGRYMVAARLRRAAAADVERVDR